MGLNWRSAARANHQKVSSRHLCRVGIAAISALNSDGVQKADKDVAISLSPPSRKKDSITNSPLAPPTLLQSTRLAPVNCLDKLDLGTHQGVLHNPPYLSFSTLRQRMRIEMPKADRFMFGPLLLCPFLDFLNDTKHKYFHILFQIHIWIDHSRGCGSIH